MASTIKRFDFTLAGPQRTGASGPPWVVIDLQRWGAESRDGSPAVSPHLMTDAEIDQYIGQLKSDLDAVANLARASLRAAIAKSKA